MEKVKGKGAWASDYFDKRAHVNLVVRNGDSALTIPQEKMVSKNRFANPQYEFYHHPAVKTVMGGISTPSDFKSKDRKQAQDLDDNTWQSKSGIASHLMGAGIGTSEGIPGQKYIKNALMEKLLYLAIVNLPSEEDLERAQDKVGVVVEAVELEI